MNKLKFFNGHPDVAVQCSGYSANVASVGFCHNVFHAFESVLMRPMLPRTARSSSGFNFSLCQPVRVVVAIHDRAHLIAQSDLFSTMCWTLQEVIHVLQDATCIARGIFLCALST